ncbi:MAG: envelope stress response membrane protein PspB [Tolumonas sp.]|uniref:envelope stress response membrane protein PspB n=1 Tax=uncultured Tolumonas sp. TaxID=263765 RepID=UPI002A0A75A0|nr:envelope stress response membrane protein PspB [uncultured Tolumonas sp.]MDD2342088.1 envelope stress response membrane protein PspB [Tolumonas sp.]MDD2841314.1 envelope stress response membrane protein PspB [Tolumonas sp.]
MSLMMFFFVPAVVFLALVAPIWLILHYWTQSRLNRGLSAEEQDQLADALALAQRLEQRIVTLETILDVQQPDWRRHDEDRNHRS